MAALDSPEFLFPQERKEGRRKVEERKRPEPERSVLKQ